MTLQEKMKSLCVENQIWRELAQTNETTTNNLCRNLEQVLAHVGMDHHVVTAVVDDMLLIPTAVHFHYFIYSLSHLYFFYCMLFFYHFQFKHNEIFGFLPYIPWFKFIKIKVYVLD
ncbi:hypothetical protein Lalb_Chr23g0275641 [Lupinus albus]|uniref:Uncharacterized protein n=1 Tax=Lupinus albus TaxID=3870 RepID=A0A6A4NJS7_LUPAL|nr:hypothetical protein Lalb_Chr23g0275641 [Lupinus albus]